MGDFTFFITMALVLVFALLATPFIFIWSVNTLFGVGIGYTFINWLAAFLLTQILAVSYARR